VVDQTASGYLKQQAGRGGSYSNKRGYWRPDFPEEEMGQVNWWASGRGSWKMRHGFKQRLSGLGGRVEATSAYTKGKKEIGPAQKPSSRVLGGETN